MVDSLQQRFQCLEVQTVLQSAVKLMDPREWPVEEESLATFGTDLVKTLTDHFAVILESKGCNRQAAITNEWPAVKVAVRRMPAGEKSKLWETWLQDEDRLQDYPNLLMLAETVLVLPLSTAAVERGFSAMKRIKNDWRSSLTVDTLSKLMYISLEGPSVEEYDGASALDRWWEGSQRARRPVLV